MRGREDQAQHMFESVAQAAWRAEVRTNQHLIISPAAAARTDVATVFLKHVFLPVTMTIIITDNYFNNLLVYFSIQQKHLAPLM